MKKISGFLFLAVLAAACLFALFHGEKFPTPHIGTLASGGYSAEVETFFSGNLPLREKLDQFSVKLLYLSGQREFDGIFIGKDGSLLKDILPPDEDTTAQSAKEIEEFVSAHRAGACVMLIPTAVIIKQQEIDSAAADHLYNQRHMITEVYSELMGKAVTIDVYQSLFAHREEYIYYNTEENLTSLGGFYVYSEYASALNLKKRPASDFNIAYAAHGFEGSLAKNAFEDYPVSDFVAMYAYTQYERKYVVTHTFADGTQTELVGLFDRETTSSDPTDLFFGGLTPITEIETNGPYEDWLLIFGDKTAKSWMPFLANHYAKVTYVDLDTATDEMLAALHISDYQQVLFAYSVDTFLEGPGLDRLASLSD